MQGKGQVGKLEQWDSLVGNLYESILNPDSLMSALSGIDKWMGSSFCHLLTWDDHANRPKSSIVTSDAFGDATKKYAEYHGLIDPRRDLSHSFMAGDTWACHDFFDEKFVSSSEFYQDLLVPAGARYILAGYVLKENGLSTYLVFNHLLGQGLFSNEQRQALVRLMPHVQRTIRLSLKNEQFRGGLVAGELGLNALEQAVFTLDVNDRVIFFNSAAQALLDATRWLRLRSSHLMPVATVEADKLSSALMRVRLTRQAESFALYGMENANGEPVATQLVTVLPIPREGVQPEEPNANSVLSLDEAELVVLVTPQQRKSAMSAGSLKALFKLTPAEARLAHELAKGTTVEGYAEGSAISVATARTQLRSILAKTGEKRLQDLVRMLSSLPSKM